MDANCWAARLSSASNTWMKRDGFDAEMLMRFEEFEANDDKREEYICPFCSEYFDIVGLCCHIDDEHPVEAKNGVCPVCSMIVGVDMIAHLTLQHGNIFKMQRKRKSRRAGSRSTLSLLRRVLREGNMQSLFGGLSTLVSSGNAASDTLLSSFIVPMVEDLKSVPSHSSIESESSKKNTNDSILDRKVIQAPLSFKDKEEKMKRCDFVQGMLLSMMLDQQGPDVVLE